MCLLAQGNLFGRAPVEFLDSISGKGRESLQVSQTSSNCGFLEKQETWLPISGETLLEAEGQESSLATREESHVFGPHSNEKRKGWSSACGLSRVRRTVRARSYTQSEPPSSWVHAVQGCLASHLWTPSSQ